MPKPIIPLSRETLLETFEYNPVDGVLIWRVSRGPIRVGDRAGCVGREGYRVIRLDGVQMREHRVIWVMVNGSIPEQCEIDHRDMNRANNALSNLRLATRSQNRANSGAQRTNRLKIKGVQRRGKSFIAVIQHNHRVVRLGTFPSAEEASAAYAAAAHLLHGSFARI